jgi:hypothetical protein
MFAQKRSSLIGAALLLAALSPLLTGCGPVRAKPDLQQTASAPPREETSTAPAAAPTPEVPQPPPAAESPPAAFPADSEPFRTLTATEKRDLEEMTRAFKGTSDSSMRLVLLREASELYGEELLPLLQLAVADRDPILREEVFIVLRDNPSPAILPLIERGMGDRLEQVREAAASALSHVRHEQVSRLLEKALDDSSLNVRLAALDTVETLPDDVQEHILERAILSRHEEVFYQALSLLEFASNERALKIMFKGLNNRNREHREEITHALEHLLDKRFTRETDAVVWWEENRHRFDRDLFERTPPPE